MENMSAVPTDGDESNSIEPFWRRIVNHFMLPIKRNECTLQAYELMAEASVVSYLVTRYVIKRPNSAFRNSMVALVFVPLIYWPICTAQKNEDVKPKDL